MLAALFYHRKNRLNKAIPLHFLIAIFKNLKGNFA